MNSGRPIDHIVLTVKDLDVAAGIYEDLGFVLTPRAAHEDRMGTSNRLAQFADRNFIELLEVDRPEKLAPHDFSQSPPFFSFGAHNRDRVADREGISLLVFTGDNARADIKTFEARQVPSYAPFDFDRLAKLPDGNEVTVSFTLAFATSPDMPGVAFFVCENRAQEHFWKPDFQKHENRALSIETVYLSSPHPDRDGAFIAKMFGGEVRSISGGVSIACGSTQDVKVLEPNAILDIDPSFSQPSPETAVLAGIAIRSDSRGNHVTPSNQACGCFIEWVSGD